MLVGLVSRTNLDVATGRTIDAGGYLEALEDSVLAQTRLGDTKSTRRSAGDEQPLRVNMRASRLLDDAHDTLSRWCRDLSESRAARWIPVRSVEPGFVGPLRKGWRRLPTGYVATPADMATWLAAHVHAIACDEGAGMCFSEVRNLIARIEKAINRPVPPEFCGPCPHSIDHDHDRSCEMNHPHACGTRLMARRGAVEVECPTCGTVHSVERLINRLLADVEHWRFSREELIGSRSGDWAGIMGLLNEQVSKSAFYRWIKGGVLKPSGYRRPDGRIAPTRRSDADEPLYRLSRLRELRTEMGDKQVAGLKNVERAGV